MVVHGDEGFRGSSFLRVPEKKDCSMSGTRLSSLFMEKAGTCLGFGVHRIRMRQWKPFPSNATGLACVQKCRVGDSFIRVGSMIAVVLNEAKVLHLGRETLKP